MLEAQGAATVAIRLAMAKACAEKLPARRGAEVQSWYDAGLRLVSNVPVDVQPPDTPAVADQAVEQVSPLESVTQEKQQSQRAAKRSSSTAAQQQRCRSYTISSAAPPDGSV